MTGAEYVALRVALDRVDKAHAVFKQKNPNGRDWLQDCVDAANHLEATVRKLVEKKVPKAKHDRGAMLGGLSS